MAPPPSAQVDVAVPAVPPLPEKLPAPVPLNTHGLAVAANFRGDMPNERGRGAFAAALLSLLEQSKLATTHLHAVRSSQACESGDGEQQFDRWSLNRLPGCTDVLLRFVNNAFVSILGLKPFMSWRSLARCMGDSREYLSHRHWQCLELKGGGRMASTLHPWQSYRTTAGHFDSLANELVEWLSWCHTEASTMMTKHSGLQASKSGRSSATPMSKLAVLAKHRAKVLGEGAPLCDSAEAINCLLKIAWDAAYLGVESSSAGVGAEVKLPVAASTSSSAKRKGITEQEHNQMARPTKRGLLAAAALTVSAYAAVVVYHGDYFEYAAAIDGFHRPSDASNSAADRVVATGLIEVGTIDAVKIGVRFSRTVSFQGCFADPVIIGGIPSRSSSSRGIGAVTRLRSQSLEDKTFEMFLDVPKIDGRPCGHGSSAPETVSWMVVEAGVWQSTNQVRVTSNSTSAGVAVTRGAIEAGSGLYGLCSGGPLCTVANGCDTCHSSGFEWRSVDFAIPHPDPIVLTQVQTYHGHDWVTQRLRNVDPSGFQVRQEEDGIHGSHVSELLGWVAFSNGAGWFNDRSQRMLGYQAIRTSQSFTSDPYTVPFEGEFSHTPALFGSLQTHRGPDPAHLRYSTKNITACTAFVEEERCSDQEVVHPSAERAGIVAIEPGLAKLWLQDKPLSTSLRGLLEAGSKDVRQVFDSDGQRKQHFFQTASSQFENPVVFLGALKYHSHARSDSQQAARIQFVRTIPRGAECPPDDADNILALAGFSCEEAQALVGCSVRSDLTDLRRTALDRIPRNTLLASVCPRTCNACGTTIVSFVVDSPIGLLNSHGSVPDDAGVCAQPDSAAATPGVVSWLVAEAGRWPGGSQLLAPSDLWPKGKVHVGSSTFGICGGGPLCTTEYGCDSCNIHEGYQWGRVEFEDSTFANPPLVMSQLQTAHGRHWVTLQNSRVSPTGFRIRMQGDGMSAGHATEQIGYMALPQGLGSLHGLQYQASTYRNFVCAPRPPAHSGLCRSILTIYAVWCCVSGAWFGQVSGSSIQWRRPFGNEGLQVEFFAQIQTTRDDAPAIVRYTAVSYPQSSANPTDAGAAITYGGATIVVEDAGCGDTTEVLSSGRTHTCCIGFAQHSAGHPTRPTEK